MLKYVNLKAYSSIRLNKIFFEKRLYIFTVNFIMKINFIHIYRKIIYKTSINSKNNSISI